MPSQVERYLGPHPLAKYPFGRCLTAADGMTQTKRPHRALQEVLMERARAIRAVQKMLTRHHASPEALERSRKRVEALKALGHDRFGATEETRRFPTSNTTRKGNLAEVVLAEYVVAASGLSLPTRWLGLVDIRWGGPQPRLPRFPRFALTGIPPSGETLHARTRGDRVFLCTADGRTRIDVTEQKMPFHSVADDLSFIFKKEGNRWQLVSRDPRVS